MKAVVVSQYGGPEVLSFKDVPDPTPGAGEVLVKVAATSINPIDIKRRTGEAKAFAPIKFPGILGVDISGTVISVGPGVKGFSAGDRVFGMGNQTYAERCVVKAESLAKIPENLDPVEAADIPLVTTTGNQLITEGTSVQRGQSVLVTGAIGSVGRSAVFTAKARGAKVIAGVRKTQLDEAKTLGVDVVALDDQEAVAKLPMLDAVADTINGATAASLMGKVKAGGTFASVLGPPPNSSEYASVKVVPVYAHPDPKMLVEMAQAVKEGKLVIPIAAIMPLKDAAHGQDMVAKGINGKVLLVV